MTEKLPEGVHRMKKTLCPTCGTELNAYTPAPGSPDVKPREGDVSFCAQCRTILIWNADLSIRAATEDEVLELAPQEHMKQNAMVLAVAAAVQALTREDLELVLEMAAKNGGVLRFTDIAALPGWGEAKAHALGFILTKSGLALTVKAS